MKIIKESIVGEIVARDYHTASIFKTYGIDFCCKGNRSIEEACMEKELAVDYIIDELNTALGTSKEPMVDFSLWDMDLLADYIEKKHHRYVRKTTPELKTFLSKVAKVHGERRPELVEIRDLFEDLSDDLAQHMQKEESILFPFLRKMVVDEMPDRPMFGSVNNPIKMMMHEHDHAGEIVQKISDLSNKYNPPIEACTTYRVSFLMLKEFENDLHQHIHLENNILFPKAIRQENKWVRTISFGDQ